MHRLVIGGAVEKIKQFFINIINSRSKTFMAFCFCFMVGCAGASIVNYGESSPLLRPPLADFGGQACPLHCGGGGVINLQLYIFASVFILLAIAIFCWHKKFVRFGILALLFIIFGVWRLFITVPDCSNPNQVCYYNQNNVTIIGTVNAEPDIRIGNARYVVNVESVCQNNNCTKSAGQVLVTTRLYPQYKFGDVLQVDCSLVAPKNSDDTNFNYPKYLASQNVFSACYPKQISVLTAAQAAANPTQPPPFGFAQGGLRKGKGPTVSPSYQEGGKGELPSPTGWLLSKIYLLKSKVQNQINRLWPEPESGFMAGLLYGSKSGLPQELMDNFSKTGLTHIIAVSGFNITIIATVLMIILIALGLRRPTAYWAVLATLFLFVIFTGATGSVVRAAIMGAVVLTAQKMGRLSNIANILVFTAAVIVLFNPYALVWDAGFQLSFLSTLGLVYVSPVLLLVIASDRRERRNPLDINSKVVNDLVLNDGGLLRPSTRLGARNDALEWLFTTLAQTLSAIIATLPLILYQFGRLSIIAPLVNVMILWIIPFLMLFGFVALILSFVFFPLGQLIALIAHFGLQYVLIIINFFGGQSWSAVSVGVPWWGMVIMYAGIIYVISTHREKTRSNS